MTIARLYQWLRSFFRRNPAPKEKFFTLVVREPLGGEKIKKVSCDGQSLFVHLGRTIAARVYLNGENDLGPGWLFYHPRDGDRIEVRPGTGVKSFTDAYIERLNAEQSGGMFLKAVIVNESPGVDRHFVDYERVVTFDGHDYQPLPMAWQDFEFSQEMALPAIRVVIPNLGGEVVDYIEAIDILEHDVVLQLLHIDLLGDTSAKDELLLQIQSIEGDDTVCTVTLGLNLGFNDILPREVILKSEFPGLIRTLTRFSA